MFRVNGDVLFGKYCKKSIKCREIRKRQYQLQKKKKEKNVHTYKLDK